MIKGKKMYLRPILKSDLKYLNKWKNDEDIFKYLGSGFIPTSIDQQEKWLDIMINLTGNTRRFIISDLNDNPIGMIGLYDIKFIHRTCEIGQYIGDKSLQGKGYGTEAYNLIEAYAKNYLNIRKIKLNVVQENNTAINFWSKLGFLKVGELVKERFIQGEYHNLIIMEKFI